jgi:hypothetical protein
MAAARASAAKVAACSPQPEACEAFTALVSQLTYTAARQYAYYLLLTTDYLLLTTYYLLLTTYYLPLTTYYTAARQH